MINFELVNPGNIKGVDLTPLGFSKSSPKPPRIFRKNLGNPGGFNVWSFYGRIHVADLRVSPTQSYEKNTKAIFKIFIDSTIQTW